MRNTECDYLLEEVEGCYTPIKGRQKHTLDLLMQSSYHGGT